MSHETRIKALERLLATPARQTPCGECGTIAPPPADPRDADMLRDQLGRKLERLAAVPLDGNAPLAAYVAQGAIALHEWPRCGTCGQMDTQAMRRRLEGSNT